MAEFQIDHWDGETLTVTIYLTEVECKVGNVNGFVQGVCEKGMVSEMPPFQVFAQTNVPRSDEPIAYDEALAKCPVVREFIARVRGQGA